MANTLEDKKLLETVISEIEQARAAFPDKLKDLLVISEYKVLFAASEIQHLVENHPKRIKQIINDSRKYLHKYSAEAAAHGDTIVKVRSTISRKKIQIIVIGSPSDSLKLCSSLEHIMYYTYLLNHEIGHLVVENGWSKPENLGECAADAYAYLRHTQIFGTRKDIFNRVYNSQENIVINAYATHYTDAVYYKIRRLLKEHDLSKLSLQETSSLAKELGENYSMDKRTLNHIKEVFGEVAENYKNFKEGNPHVLRDVFNKTMEHKDDPIIYAIGSAFLQARYNRRYTTEDDPFWLDKSDPFWKDAFKRKKAFERVAKPIRDISVLLEQQKDAIVRSAIPKRVKKANNSIS